MLDYERITDDVRNSLFVQGAEDADYLRAIVADFAVACEEVNERLQQCESLLRRGLRSEALHLCEMEPNLLDAVAALDFPERGQWEEFIGQFGLVPPLPVNIEAAEALSEAYAAEQPMAKLLRNHRLLALARGPLSERIATLRRLADADPASPVWADDLDLFERARLEQIRGEALAAGKRGDLDALRRLHREIHDPSWRNPPAPHVVESVTAAHDRLLYAYVSDQLAATEAALNDAFSAFDVDGGRERRERWNELLGTPGFVPPEPLGVRAAPALEWLEEQDDLEERRQRHVSAVSILEQALNRGRTLAHLERLYHDATRDGENVPAALERRYQSRVASLKLSATRRLRLTVLAITGALLLAAGGVWWAVDWQLHRSRIEEVRVTLAELIHADDLEAAETYRVQLADRRPEMLEAPAIAALAARLDRLINDENERSIEFRHAIAAVEESVKGNGPEPIRPDVRALATAEKLAKTAREKTHVAELNQQVEDLHEEHRQEQIAAVRSEFDSLDEQLVSLDRRAYPTLAQYRQPMDEAQRMVDMLSRRADELKAPGLFRSRIKAVNEHLEKLREGLERQAREEESLVKIAVAMGNANAYQAVLRSHAGEFVTSPRASEFIRVAGDRKVWEAVVQFSALAERWAQEIPDQLTPALAAEYLTLVRPMFGAHRSGLENAPFGMAIRERVPLLEAVARRERGTVQDAFERELDQRVMRDCWCVYDRARGKRYYILEQPRLQPGFNNIRYVVNRAGEQRGGAMRGDEAEVTVAAQVTLTTRLREMLSELNHHNWETQWYCIMEAIYRADDLDELLRFDLLRMALGAAVHGSDPMARAFQQHTESFSRAQVNLFANWMDPTCADAEEARGAARAELDNMPSFAVAWKETQEQLETLWQPPDRPYRWAAWLRKNIQGQWEVVVRDGTAPSGPAFVFFTEEAEVRSLQIGTLEGGRLALEPTADASLLEGLPVFVAGSEHKQP